jgi:hypothetical protein
MSTTTPSIRSILFAITFLTLIAGHVAVHLYDE